MKKNTDLMKKHRLVNRSLSHNRVPAEVRVRLMSRRSQNGHLTRAASCADTGALMEVGGCIRRRRRRHRRVLPVLEERVERLAAVVDAPEDAAERRVEHADRVRRVVRVVPAVPEVQRIVAREVRVAPEPVDELRLAPTRTLQRARLHVRQARTHLPADQQQIL